MKPRPVHRLHALLEAAAQRLKLAARASVERTIESLGLAALAAGNVFQRDALLGAQFELNRKSAMFALAFNDCLDERLMQDSAPPSRSGAETPWDALGLVEDVEVERKISADRFGLEVQHACEWELRELEGYVGSLLGPTPGTQPAAAGDRWAWPCSRASRRSASAPTCAACCKVNSAACWRWRCAPPTRPSSATCARPACNPPG